MDGLGRLGIDIWWVIYYLVNYGIILALLGYYVYPKIDDVLEKRKTAINNSLDSANKLKKELAKEVEKFHAEHEKILKEAREQKKKWLIEIENLKAQIIKEMDEKKAQSLKETQTMIDERKSAIFAEAKKEIYTIFIKSFQKLSQKIPEPVITESIDEAWSTIHKSK